MLAPSPFIMEWLSQLKPGDSVLDIACGKGRHTRAALSAGLKVTAVDIDTSGLEDISSCDTLEIVTADLEGAPWPLGSRTFDAVIVSNYLWRPLFPALRASVTPGGLIIYETFGAGNELYGKPSNPNFLLEDGELRKIFADGFEVLFCQHGIEALPAPAMRQKLIARKL